MNAVVRPPATMKKTFQPADLQPFKRRMYLVFTPFLLYVLYDADGWEARVLFLGVVAVFLVIVHTLLARAAHQGRPIVLDAAGLHHEPLRERYGSQDIPWHEVKAIDLVLGAKRAEWLSLTLHDGRFRDSLERPATDRLARGDVFVPLLHDSPGRTIVDTAQQFWQRYRSQRPGPTSAAPAAPAARRPPP